MKKSTDFLQQDFSFLVLLINSLMAAHEPPSSGKGRSLGLCSGTRGHVSA